MKKLFDNKILQIGFGAFAVIAASIVFYFFMSYLPAIVSSIGKLIKILSPLIIGLILAYIMNPLVKLFEKKVFNKINREPVKRNLSIFCSMIIIFAVIITLVSVVLPQLFLSIESLVVNSPVYFNNLEKAILNWIKDNQELEKLVTDNYDQISIYLTNFLTNSVLPFANNMLANLSSGIVGVFSGLFNLVIGFVFAIYILSNTNTFAAQIRKTLYSFFDVSKVNGFIEETKHINDVFSRFMIGKICDSFGFVFVCTFLFLLIFKYPYALLIAVIIGITDLIPYFGPYIGSIPSTILILLVSPVKAITFILFIVVLQQIDGNLITPKIQKQATGLPSFWVLFSITLFGGLFGIIGILIAVPCFTIIYELIVDAINNRLKKKQLPTNTDYYYDLDGIEIKRVKAKIVEE